MRDPLSPRAWRRLRRETRLQRRLLVYLLRHRLPLAATLRRLRDERHRIQDLPFLLNVGYLRNAPEVNATIMLERDYVTCVRSINPAEHAHLLSDKTILFARFPTGMGRSFLDCRTASTRAITAFIRREQQIVGKRNHGFAAAGFGRYDTARMSLPWILDALRTNGQDLLEGTITQHPAIAAVYPQAVNTLRIHTMSDGREVRSFLRPKIRFGAAGAITDVASRVAYRAVVNGDGSLVDAVRIDRSEQITKSTRHHDSGVAFADVTVPFVEESIALACQGARAFPELPFIGWDIAVTPTGPVIVEGNALSKAIGTLQMIEYLFRGRGLRPELETMRRYCLGDRPVDRAIS